MMPSLPNVHSAAATRFGGRERRIFMEMHTRRALGHHVQAPCQPRAQSPVRLAERGK